MPNVTIYGYRFLGSNWGHKGGALIEAKKMLFDDMLMTQQEDGQEESPQPETKSTTTLILDFRTLRTVRK